MTRICSFYILMLLPALVLSQESRQRKPYKAIVVFELNILAFPGSWNVYWVNIDILDSLKQL